MTLKSFTEPQEKKKRTKQEEEIEKLEAVIKELKGIIEDVYYNEIHSFYLDNDDIDNIQILKHQLTASRDIKEIESDVDETIGICEYLESDDHQKKRKKEEAKWH